MDWTTFAPWIPAYLALGCLGGFASGLLGIGGGMIYVPLLTGLFELQRFAGDSVVHLALGTSMTTIVFTSMSSARAHQGRGNVDWRIVRGLVPGLVIGGLLGGAIARRLDTSVLALIFAGFVSYSAMQMFLNAKPKPSRQLPGLAGLAGAGTVISTLSQLVGAGGGFLTVPFLTWCNVAMHRAVGTSAAVGLPIAAIGTIAFFLNGRTVTDLPPGSFGYIYLPALALLIVPSMLLAPFGAKVGTGLPVATLKRLFAAFLFVLALKMLYSALRG